jgi:hypothetical protein
MKTLNLSNKGTMQSHNFLLIAFARSCEANELIKMNIESLNFEGNCHKVFCFFNK